MPLTVRVEQVGSQHGIKADSTQSNAVCLQHLHVKLDILADLVYVRVFQQWPEILQHFLPRQLARLKFNTDRLLTFFRKSKQRPFGTLFRARLGTDQVPDRNIICLMFSERERQSDDFGITWIKAGGFQVNGKLAGFFQITDQLFQLIHLSNSLVLFTGKR